MKTIQNVSLPVKIFFALCSFFFFNALSCKTRWPACPVDAVEWSPSKLFKLRPNCLSC